MISNYFYFDNLGFLAFVIGLLIFVVVYQFLSKPLGRGSGVLTGIVLGILGGYYFYQNETLNNLAGASIGTFIIIIAIIIFLKIAWSFMRSNRKIYSFKS